jgi:shikimate dehydrogenase
VLSTAPPVRCAVLGRPIAHSLSPVMHRAAYASLGLDWTYAAHDVGIDELPAFVAGLDDSWRGLSLTMPLKRAVLPLLDEVSAVASQVGAVNTVVRERGRLIGDNTDVGGAVAALAEAGCTSAPSAVVVGAGATAESVLVALQQLGLERLHVVARDAGRAAPLVTAAQSAGVLATAGPLDGVAPAADLLVSTVPGSAGVVLPDALVGAAAVVFDVAYDPWPSPLLARVAGSGATTVDGLALLTHQAVLQVELMTGSLVPAALLRSAALEALGPQR